MPHDDPKHRAKRFNEGLKLTATLVNATAIITIGSAFLGPLAQKHYDVFDDGGWAFLLGAAILHFFGSDNITISARGGLIAMPSTFVLQIVGTALAIGIVALGGVVIASWQFERNTRKIEARKSER